MLYMQVWAVSICQSLKVSGRAIKWTQKLQVLAETCDGRVMDYAAAICQTVHVGLKVSGSACKWRSRVQLSVRNFRWMQPLQVLGVTVGGDLPCNCLPKPTDGSRA